MSNKFCSEDVPKNTSPEQNLLYAVLTRAAADYIIHLLYCYNNIEISSVPYDEIRGIQRWVYGFNESLLSVEYCCSEIVMPYSVYLNYITKLYDNRFDVKFLEIEKEKLML